VSLDVRAAGLGEREGLAAVRLLGADQALVGELLESRVDGAGAGLPAARAARGDILDDLVSGAGLLGEQREDCGADVAALGLPGSAEPSAEGHAARSERAAGPEAAPRAAPPVAAPVPVLVRTGIVMLVLPHGCPSHGDAQCVP
jgi:hypothetical protein